MDESSHPKESPEPNEPAAAAGQLADEAGRAADEARSKAEGITDEFSAQLAALESRAQKAHSNFRRSQNQAAEAQRKDGEATRGIGVGLTIAYAIVGIPLFCYGVGWLIDGQVGGRAWQSWLTILGSGGAVAYALFILNRTERK